jgi:hypothetical protein
MAAIEKCRSVRYYKAASGTVYIVLPKAGQANDYMPAHDRVRTYHWLYEDDASDHYLTESEEWERITYEEALAAAGNPERLLIPIKW